MLRTIGTVVDTLSQKPELGVFSGMVGVALSPIAIISLISASFGLLIAIITLIIKMMDMLDKIKKKRLIRNGVKLEEDDYIIIGDKKYKYEKDIAEE